MLSLFKPIRDRQPPRYPPSLDNVKRTVMENYHRCVKYWQGMNWSVRSEHMLVGILNQIHVENHDPLAVYRSADVQSAGLVGSRGLINSITYGRVQPKSDYYGITCKEIIIDQRFDNSVDLIFTTHYSKWDPIRVVRHPFTTFDYQLANGKKRTSGEEGLVIIKIDLALLYTQYRLWRLDKIRSVYEDGTPKSVMNFIHSYPVVNMLKTHLDCVWYNRFLNICLNRPNLNDRGDQRLALISSYPYMDQIHQKLKTDMERSRANFHEWLCWIPGLFTKNYKEFLLQDSVLQTHQIKLAFALGWYPAMEWLFKMEASIHTGADTLYRNEYLKANREYRSNRVYGSIRGLNYYDIEKQFEENITVFANQL